MIIAEPREIQEILDRVKGWPRSQRVTLAQRILDESAQERLAMRGSAADDVVGLLRVTGAAPTDAECRQMIEDELLRKYSG